MRIKTSSEVFMIVILRLEMANKDQATRQSPVHTTTLNSRGGVSRRNFDLFSTSRR